MSFHSGLSRELTSLPVKWQLHKCFNGLATKKLAVKRIHYYSSFYFLRALKLKLAQMGIWWLVYSHNKAVRAIEITATSNYTCCSVYNILNLLIKYARHHFLPRLACIVIQAGGSIHVSKPNITIAFGYLLVVECYITILQKEIEGWNSEAMAAGNTRYVERLAAIQSWYCCDTRCRKNYWSCQHLLPSVSTNHVWAWQCHLSNR